MNCRGLPPQAFPRLALQTILIGVHVKEWFALWGVQASTLGKAENKALALGWFPDH